MLEVHVPQVRSCVIYFFDGWIGVSPTVIGIARGLAGRGYQVVIYCRRTDFASPGELGSGIVVRYTASLGKIRRALPRISQAIDLLLFWIASRPGRKSMPMLHIGVDKLGATAAFLASRKDNGPIVHLSLELNQIKERGGVAGFLNGLFRKAYSKSACCVIQDAERFEALSASMGYVHPKTFFIPNAPGMAPAITGQPNFFREILPLPVEQFPNLIVHAGIVEDIVFSLELAEAFASIDLGCALIFHERLAREESDPYLVEMRNRNRRNLFFSLRPLPYMEIDRIFSAATIGLAFYRPISANLALMARASGKIAFHLKHGTPVIMNDLPSFIDLNERYDIGATVHDPASAIEMERALRYCLDNYARLSANARRCFVQEFCPETRINLFLDFVAFHFPIC
jgi:hypothetical protein